MAILVDQYDCVELVQPWLDSWLANDVTRSKKNRKEGWLFIAWVFGRESVFAALANKLLLEVKIGTGGECMTEDEDVLPELMPPQIVGK